MTLNRRVAIYARVSTSDKDQNPETQLLPLKKYAGLRGWSVFEVYVDKESGRFEKKGRREAFNRMLADARKRRFDILLVFRYSRFARSTKDLVDALGDFEALGIDFVSYSENIDTTTSHGRFFFTVIAAFAQLEFDTISENVRAGLARARQEGKRLGRPPVSTYSKERIIETWRQHGSIKKTAKVLGKPYATVHKIISAYKAEHPDEKTVRLELWLRVENNNKFVRGKTRSREEIEAYLRRHHNLQQPDKDGWEYTLTVTYRTDEELDDIIYRDILGEAQSMADSRNGFIEADVREVGGQERSW